ncbi:MAG: endonuclease VIII [Acidobacteriota bacterium]
MPEGPEIRLEADKVHRAVAGRVANEVWCALEPVAEAAAALSGRQVTRVESWGKAMLTHFEGGRVIYSHNQLYGRWYVKKAGELPKTGRSLRLAIHNDAKSALLYSASDIEVLDEDRLDQHPFLAKLGPDLLSHDLEASAVLERLEDRRFAGRQLASLLLDQGFVAGLGNYLRAEVLHTSGIDPRRKPKQLEDDEKKLLAQEILRLTRKSYETRGITNDAERVERLKAQGLTRSKYRYQIYNRENQDCYRCDSVIQRQNLGGRALFWCPRCQV